MTDRIFLSADLSCRRLGEDGSLGEGGCSMRITEDVRRYAAEQGISEDAALEVGLQQKAKEFVKKGSEVYAKT